MELDMGILEVQENTKTTMADMYGYSVFSRDFLQSMQQEQEQEKEIRESYLQNVFTNEAEDEIGEAFERVFAAQSTVVVREDFATKNSTETSNTVLASFGILGALLASGVWVMIDRVRKGKRIHENKDNNH